MKPAIVARVWFVDRLHFLGVGEESKSGDAIALRFGNLFGARNEQTVVVIDGGFMSTGEKVVEHIRSHFNTDVVDIVISTHPDQDHINGLETVLTELTVRELWIHQPWNHNQKLADKFSDGRVTDNSLGQRLKENLERACSLIKLAEKKGITVREPFTGLQDASGCLKVLGPSQQYYEELLPDFDGMPERVTVSREAIGDLLKGMLASVKRFFATWGHDHQLSDDAVTSAKNNSSVITQLIVDGKRLIFSDEGGEELQHFYPAFGKDPNRTIDIIIREGERLRRVDATWWFDCTEEEGRLVVGERTTFNARNLDSPYWKTAIRSRRAIIVGTGLGESKIINGKKHQYLMTSASPILIGAVYRKFPGGQYSCALITRGSHPRFDEYHDKAFPLFLPYDSALLKLWLSDEREDNLLIAS